ncbi:MAG: hypothetical protein HY898_16620 [Deltaproteobacteria bacterium]|nr:hypothetical protein [Deltaproteobacteria bacterium]
MRASRWIPALMVTVCGCGGNVQMGPPPACTPGAKVACKCQGGEPGMQVCNALGTEYGECVAYAGTAMFQSRKMDKVDLLLMIDNSASMADKQEVLAVAVPDLIERLVNPLCNDGNPADAMGKCAPGFMREFDPVNDIHIGVISSSIGGHGADSCSDVPTAQYNPRMADMSHLIERADPMDPSKKESTWNNQGFLAWDPKAKYNPPGDSNVQTLKDKFTAIVRGTGQDGCGFEASLEAWYRFLVDPAPYQRMVPFSCDTNQAEQGGQCRGPEGVDLVVLRQRDAFVRPDSVLGVVMLTDENDCSIVDGWQNYIAVQAYSGQNPWHLPRATSQCQTDPNGPQCMSCAQGDFSTDPECSKGLYYSDIEDSLNLRCFRQKQRFGIDFTYPIRRYVNGLSKRVFSAADVAFPVNPGFAADKDFNPLYCTKYRDNGDGTFDMSVCETVLRDSSSLFLAAIVGVPWQDIANNPNDLKQGYRPVEQLGWKKSQFESSSSGASIPPGVTETITVWDQILGKVITDTQGDTMGIDFSPAGEPKDPLMIESIEPRSGTSPATGEALADMNAATPTANRINGHEWDIKGRNDLQYACTFKLQNPKDCSANSSSCDCAEADGLNNPLCQTETGSYGKTQYRAKAYPGRRQLAVLHGLDPSQAVLASICPSNTDNPSAEDFGYRPAIKAIVNRFKKALGPKCWGSPLKYNGDGTVPCTVLEATKYPEGTTTCPSCVMAGRVDPSAEVVAELAKNPDFVQNGLKCVCEIQQAQPGAPLTACIESTEDPVIVMGAQVDGWCWVDPAAHPGANAQLVLGCAANAKRTLRFVGAGNSMAGAVTFLRCAP